MYHYYSCKSRFSSVCLFLNYENNNNNIKNTKQQQTLKILFYTTALVPARKNILPKKRIFAWFTRQLFLFIMSTEDLEKHQTEVLEGLSSINKRMISIINSTENDHQDHQTTTEQPPEPSSNQNHPNSDQNPNFNSTIKEILTLLLSYLLSYIQLNFPLQPTTIPTTIPSSIPSNRSSNQNKNKRNRTRKRRKKNYHQHTKNNSTASAIYTLNNTMQQYIHLRFPSKQIQKSTLTGNPGFDS